MKKVLFTTGGTGGHIYPALAVADKLKEKEIESVFVGSRHRMEKEFIPKSGYRFIELDIIPFKSLKSIFKLIKCIFQSISILRREKADAIFGFGNYISVPVLVAAVILRKKIYLQEQNSELGIANRLFYRFSKKTFLAFEKTYDDLPIKYQHKLIVSGNPLRKEFLFLDEKAEREKLKVREDEKVLLITGGSQGSRDINNAVFQKWNDLFKESDIRVYWSTGKNNFEEINNKISKLKPNDVIKPYVENMPSIMTASDLIVCRAGAMAISEIIELEKPVILIPLNAGGQRANSKMLEEKSAAYVYDNKDIPEAIEKAIELIKNDVELNRLKGKIKTFKEGNAVDIIIENLDIWGNS
jgi:UDP-N-acetylglucosamine--N-acetylmuramyl-(pentapeptide) pyrophosphoryl-undecaprenol N-acetylglucosamine transferase